MLFKSILFVAGTFVLTTTAVSQSKYTKTYLGIRQGMNNSKLLTYPVLDQSPKTGLCGGLVFRYIAQRHAGIQMELNYTQKGWIENVDTLKHQYKRSMAYLELPIMTHIYFGSKKTKFYLNFGVMTAYLISDKETRDSGISSDDFQDYYGKSLSNVVEYGFAGGFGLQRDFGFGIVGLDLRYTHSMNDIFNNQKKTSLFLFTQNQCFSVAFNILFDLSKKE